MLKIGFMDYANVYPIFHYLLQDHNLSFKKGYPAELNIAMRNSEIDISPTSSIEFARNSSLYKIVSDVCVSSVGAVKSVNLYSKYKADQLDGKKIYFTKESNTSTVLCRIVLEKFYQIKPIYVDNQNECDAALLIGDKALYEYYNGNSENIIDLGKEWYDFTRLPFVFALWIINKKALNDSYFNTFMKNLSKYAELFPKDIETLAPKYLSSGFTLEQMEDYWETIRYKITEEHKKGLSLFYKYAYELGEIPEDVSEKYEEAMIFCR